MADSHSEWTITEPEVNEAKELVGVARDFSDPLEALREAVSNAFDAGATKMEISFEVVDMFGEDTVVLRVSDDGCGMNEETLRKCFFGLGYSSSDGDSSKIGEKGHGTKTFLNAKKIEVISRVSDSEGAIGEVLSPWESLDQREVYQIRTKKAASMELMVGENHGTDIFAYGFNQNNRSKFTQAIIKDYLLWFSKLGSVEKEFDILKHEGFCLRLKALGEDKFEEIQFGHQFPAESSSVDVLFDTYLDKAPDHYVKRWTFNGHLECAPEVKYEMVVFVEGDAAKRSYNKMLNPRRSNSITGRYAVSSRYGVYLCKDHIPIKNVTDWIRGFGTGSNSARTLLHGFINCQKVALTANRGDVSFRQPAVHAELEQIVNDHIGEIDSELAAGAFHELRDLREEEKRKSTEEAEYKRRRKSVSQRKYHRLSDGQLLWRPENETEALSLFMALHGHFDSFSELDPLDYNANVGVDMLAKLRDPAFNEGNHPFYVEFKNLLNPSKFNHSWKNLKYVVCWDIADGVSEGDECTDALGDKGYRIGFDEDGEVFIHRPGKHIIKIIRLSKVCSDEGILFDQEWSKYTGASSSV